MPTFEYDNVQEKTLSPQTMRAIAEQIKADIDAFCVKELSDEHRSHLGASVIGHDCSRAIWYAFRWCKSATFEGRMLRLFERGKLEEERFVKWLRGIGCQVWEVVPSILHYHPETDSYFFNNTFDPGDGLVNDVTGMPEHEAEAKRRGLQREQFRIWGVQGHYGGSQDAAGMLPYLPDLPILMEFKTHNEKSFNYLYKNTLKLAKFEHYAQMCSYGKFYGFRYGLYVAICKDDDDLYIELVELDWNIADQLVKKAADIINSPVPPFKIAQQANYFKCKWCVHQDICHFGAPIEINCRSCKFAVPVENARWKCNRYNDLIPDDFIPKGCSGHVPITAE